MLTRRSALLGTAVAGGALAALPAVAQREPLRGHPRSAPAANEPPPAPANTPLGPVATAAQWAFIEDYDTGAVLLEKNADAEMAPSSMTKLMTLYIVYSRLQQGRLKLTDMLPVSEKAWRMGGSKMFVQIGTEVSVEDLIQGIEVDSGNDACVVLAEAISGSEPQFADLMNETAKKLGLQHSHFVNSSGWPADDHYMSARDIATLAAAIIRRFPDYYHFADEKEFTYNKIRQYNRNPMVQRGTADGLKTGHTDAGGYGLVASTLRGNRRVILVLNGLATSRERIEESERLMDWAFTNFDDVTLFAAGQPVEPVPVWLGANAHVPAVGEGAVVATLPRNWRTTAKISVAYDAPVRAPVAKGAKLGTLTVSGQGVPAAPAVTLVAGETVPKLSVPGRAVAVLLHFVTGS